MQNRFTANFRLRFLLFAFLLFPLVASAQDPNAFRVSKWRPDSLGAGPEKYLLVGLGSGYGFSTWNHTAKGVYQHSGSNTLLFPNSPGGMGFFNLGQSIEQQAFTGAGTDISDKRDVVYKGTGGTIPINLDILYNFGKFRFGLTGGYEFYRVSTLKYQDGTYSMADQELSGKRSLVKYGLQLEYMPVDLQSWRFGIQAKGGMFNMLGDIDKDLSKKGRLMFGGGLIVEKPLNDAFFVYAAPTYEYRSYSSDGLENDVVAENTFGTVFLNVGVRARLDNLFAKYPMCPIPACHSRKVHMHSGSTYRGQPWFKKQNPRVGENLPREKKGKNGSKRIKKPYVIKDDPAKQAKKAKKILEKNKKKQAKGKNQVLDPGEGTQDPNGAEIGEDGGQQEDRKSRRKKKRKGEQAPPPADNEDDY